jgi:hypothetical protein
VRIEGLNAMKVIDLDLIEKAAERAGAASGIAAK